MFGFGAPELLIIAVALIAVALPLAGLVDAAIRPEPAFVAAGQNKVVWIVINAVGLFACGIGAVIALIYFFIIRPKVVAATPPTA